MEQRAMSIATAAASLAREASELALLARSAEEACAVAATWPPEVASSVSLVERVSRVAMDRKLGDVVGRANGLIAAAQVPTHG